MYRVMRGGELSGLHMSRAAANSCVAVPRVAALSLSRAIRARYLVPGGLLIPNDKSRLFTPARPKFSLAAAVAAALILKGVVAARSKKRVF